LSRTRSGGSIGADEPEDARGVKRILIVDDEQSMREMLAILLAKEGLQVRSAGSRAEAAAALRQGPVDVVLTDVKLPDGDGLEILRHVKAASPETAVVVMTAYGTAEMAVAARKLGAEAYILKPFDVDELRIVVRDALANRRLREENLRLKREVGQAFGLDRVIGVSQVMASLFEMVRAIAPTSSTVLVTGESGSGKELVARAIHGLSGRPDGPFVSVNCGALPDTLLESELFGHVKGAFTDAHQSKKGLFEAAHGGTLFLDEVGETSLAMQVKLLRALQERRIRRVGGTDETEVDVRVIAATNAPLEELVKQKRFREDLYYRLQVIPIHTPPLRERREDIPLLAEHFTARQRAPARKRHRAGRGARDHRGGAPGAAARRGSAAAALGGAAGHRRRFQPGRVPAVGRSAPRGGGARALGGRARRGRAPARDLGAGTPLPGPEARAGAT
jgi:two-component system response regulator PilR (NtrC family)